MSEKVINHLKLRQFAENDSIGLIAMQNLIYPDHPLSLDSFRHHEKTRSSKIQHKHWLWEKDGTFICSALYTQWEEVYHPHKFVIKIFVHPDHRDRGYGDFCYNFIMKKLEKIDPIKISAHVYESHAYSVDFLKNRGFKNTFIERESNLDLMVYDPKLYKEKLDSVLQQGFRIITLAEFRKEDERADYKAWGLERDVGPDMPWPDPITIPEFDIYKKTVLAHPKFNADSWFFILDGNRIIGLNNLWKNEIDKGINTGLTGVRREYRRKGVASALKHTSLSWAKANGYEWVRTDNVSINEGMLSINIRAGFKFMPAWLLFEKVLKEEK